MPAGRPRPRKPYDPLTVALFGAAGERPRLEVEFLPEDDRAAEAMVAERFVNGLARLGRTTRVLDRIGEFPDARVEIDQREIGVELVEVVNPHLRARNIKRRWYGTALSTALGALPDALTGITILIDDSAREDPWPPARTEEAQEIISDLTAAVFTNAGQLANLEPYGQGYIQAEAGVLTRAPDISLLITCFHRGDTESLLARFTEASNESADARASLLRERIADKVAAGYATRAPLWLLAWTTGGYCYDALALWRAWDLLEAATHAFERVWALGLDVGGDALPIEIWPSQPDEARPPDPEEKTFVVSLDLQDGMMGPPGPQGSSFTSPPIFPLG